MATMNSAGSLPGYRATLLRRVKICIAPWRASTNRKPDFSMSELVVMACLSKDRSMSAEEIIKWIMRTFHYYGSFAHDQFYTGRQSNDAVAFRNDFSDVFLRIDMPLQRHGRIWHTIDETEDEWFVDTSAAERYLATTLGSPAYPSHRSCKFLKLPAELRHEIYSLVLSFPILTFTQSGLNKSGKTKSKLSALPAPLTGSNDRAQWENPFVLPEKLIFDHDGHQLALLSVNKQISEEATPVFCSSNHFAFDNMWDLTAFLKQAPQTRLVELRHISFTHSPAIPTPSSNTFRILRDLPHLKRLEISISEVAWHNRRKKKTGAHIYPDIHSIPGMDVLKTLRGLTTVNFHGDCEQIKALLEPEMTRPKPEPNPRARKGISAGRAKIMKVGRCSNVLGRY